MTKRGERLAKIAAAVVSEAAATPLSSALSLGEDAGAVLDVMGLLWLSGTGRRFAELCEEKSIAYARLRDFHWGLSFGYELAKRELETGALERMFEGTACRAPTGDESTKARRDEEGGS